MVKPFGTNTRETTLKRVFRKIGQKLQHGWYWLCKQGTYLWQKITPKLHHLLAKLEEAKNALGLEGFSIWLFLPLALLWLAVFLLLVAGLVTAIWDVWQTVPIGQGDTSTAQKAATATATAKDGAAAKNGIWSWRLLLLRLSALTATLGAVLALPMTLYRLRLRRRQAEIAEEALFNDKIKAVTDDLYARRLVTKFAQDGKPYDCWEDDIARRNAALDRLEGFLLERPDMVARIARLLGSYVRELSKENPAQRITEQLSLAKLRKWVDALEVGRSDLEHAVQILGSLANITGECKEIHIDLRGANLQKFDLSNLSFYSAVFSKSEAHGVNFQKAKLERACFRGANLHGASFLEALLKNSDFSRSNIDASNFARANLEGALLSDANGRGARFEKANLNGADLSKARLQGAIFLLASLEDVNFFGAQLQRANLSGANMKRAYLYGVQLQNAFLNDADFTGAALKNVDCTSVNFTKDMINSMFGDGSVKLPKGIVRPDHWPKRKLHSKEFVKEWKSWLDSEYLWN